MEVEAKMMELILFWSICFSIPVVCGILGALVISRQIKKQYKEYAKELHNLINAEITENNTKTKTKS